MILGPFRSNAPIGPNIYVWGSQAKKWQYGAAILYDTHHITYGQVAGEIWHWITTLPLHGQIFLTAWLLLNISAAHIWQNSLLKYSAKYLPNFALFYCTSSPHPTPSRAGRAPPLTVEPDKKRGKVPDFLSLTTWRQRIIFVVFISLLYRSITIAAAYRNHCCSFQFCTGPLQLQSIAAMIMNDNIVDVVFVFIWAHWYCYALVFKCLSCWDCMMHLRHTSS